MSNQNTRAEKLKVLFATHPKTDLFYMTSDDVAFLSSIEQMLMRSGSRIRK